MSCNPAKVVKNLMLSALGVVFAVAPAAAAVLYSQNFDVDDSANWTLNNGPSDATADYFFDYSTVGIPAAPNSGGTTLGMKLQANLLGGIFSGMSVSPTGQSFAGDYSVTFDWWSNYNGPMVGGGSGSTNLSTFGIGTAGTSAQWPGGTQDSVWFAATGDGGSSADWRAYSTAAPASYGDASGVYAAGADVGSRNNTDSYYAGFGNVAAPAAQLALYPQQTGNTPIGSAGMTWHEVDIVKNGDLLTWLVDGVLIATIDLTTVTLSGSNIFFGHSDINSTSSTDPNDVYLLFTLIDNIRVHDERPDVSVPEPTTAALTLLGLGTFAMFRRTARRGRGTQAV